ncbi:MAG: sugar transferase [Puniceicoccales bacterium]|jgi:lipopolysaccharide/colanic/teichoic acid biosynthesis glycosyltransferase|nr:sugar transferase [Puniceicoccales bacterium]
MDVKVERFLRFLEVISSIFIAIALLPIMFIVAALSRLEIKKVSIFFLQERIGKDGKPFNIIKFRTMRRTIADAEDDGILNSFTEKLVTKFGKFLRKTRLDELPQIFNVIKGDMSFIGHRPLTMSFFDLINNDVEYRKILKFKPGITGYATLKILDYENNVLSNAENRIDAYRRFIFPKKMKYNLEYLKKKGLWLDMNIIFMTGVVFCRYFVAASMMAIADFFDESKAKNMPIVEKNKKVIKR